MCCSCRIANVSTLTTKALDPSHRSALKDVRIPPSLNRHPVSFQSNLNEIMECAHTYVNLVPAILVRSLNNPGTQTFDVDAVIPSCFEDVECGLRLLDLGYIWLARKLGVAAFAIKRGSRQV